MQNWREGHEWDDIPNYSHYFLGSIIVNVENGNKFIVDGQQRLTTITLLLIYLNKLQKETLHNSDDEVLVENLIYSKKHGKKSFNINIKERKGIMEAIYSDRKYEIRDKSESIKNIKYRYDDIVQNFPESLKVSNDHYILPYFIDWFTESVDLVEITTYSEDDAYTIFETMNDRGLNLSPADMLKGFILTNIKDEEKRETANELWRNQINKLIEYDKKEESDFFKVWLRAKYAESMRERKKGASNNDFELIGSQFNRWVRDNKNKLNLNSTNDYFEFVEEFLFFSDAYLKIKNSADNLIDDYEHVFYNNYNYFTLEFPMILSAIKSSDKPEVVDKKIKLISKFIDTFIVLKAINRKALGYSSIIYTVFNIIKKIRDNDLEILSENLKSEINALDEKFEGFDYLILHSRNKRFIHFLLARITDYIEQKSKMESNFNEYIQRGIKDPYEIEHVIPDIFSDYADEFYDVKEFEEYRNRVGNLLLLPSSFNKSFGASNYAIKVDHYFGQNLLAQSLNKKCYERNPSFNKFIEESRLPFKSFSNFSKDEINQRQYLYKNIVEEIWNLDKLDHV
ncbi:hypothetical protein DSECCO2_573360 [anaerobic digester metagenome]